MNKYLFLLQLVPEWQRLNSTGTFCWKLWFCFFTFAVVYPGIGIGIGIDCGSNDALHPFCFRILWSAGWMLSLQPQLLIGLSLFVKVFTIKRMGMCECSCNYFQLHSLPQKGTLENSHYLPYLGMQWVCILCMFLGSLGKFLEWIAGEGAWGKRYYLIGSC